MSWAGHRIHGWPSILGRVFAVVVFVWLVLTILLGALLQLNATRYLFPWMLTGALTAGFGLRYWFRNRDRPWRAVLGIGLLGLVFVGGWAPFWWSRPMLLGACDQALQRCRGGLESDGEECLRALERFHREEGHYPESLGEAGCEPRWNPFGGWQYQGRGDNYRLRAGDYMADGFVLESSTAQPAWSWDM